MRRALVVGVDAVPKAASWLVGKAKATAGSSASLLNDKQKSGQQQ